MLYSGSCLEECPSATFSSNGRCISCQPACLVCQNRTTCDVCIATAVLFNGSCKASCPEGHYTSLQSTSSNYANTYSCQQCSSNCRTCFGDSFYDCWTCNSGYYLYFDMCLTSCPAGYFPDNITMMCQSCPASC